MYDSFGFLSLKDSLISMYPVVSMYQNNMAEEGVKLDDKIKVTVKTPRDKKEVYVEGNGSIRQVIFDNGAVFI